MNPGTPELGRLLEVALELARQAGQITLRYYGTALTGEAKPDGTPVTAADRATESFLRDRIGTEFPGHGILGEEFGETNPGADIRWVLDPIDGTKTFMRSIPLYGVLIGVEFEGVSMAGVAHFPALGETVGAALGHGCTWNGRPARVSQVDTLSAASVLTTDPVTILQDPMATGWERLSGAASMVRTWGDCYGHILVATGRAEVMVDPILSPWDAAPFPPILAEAGGRFTDREGHPGWGSASGISTNGILHEEVLAILAGS